jgi:hypothetical protein
MRVDLDLKLVGEGAAFQDGMHSIETARILRALADAIFEGTEGRFDLRDINGNYVGSCVFDAWEEGV